MFHEKYLSLKIKIEQLMNLTALRDELLHLTTLVEAWNTSHEIPEIERDLLLEKLRKLYEAVRFGLDSGVGSQPAAKDEEDNHSEPIDFDVMIGLEPLSDDSAGRAQAEPSVAVVANSGTTVIPAESTDPVAEANLPGAHDERVAAGESGTDVSGVLESAVGSAGPAMTEAVAEETHAERNFGKPVAEETGPAEFSGDVSARTEMETLHAAGDQLNPDEVQHAVEEAVEGVQMPLTDKPDGSDGSEEETKLTDVSEHPSDEETPSTQIRATGSESLVGGESETAEGPGDSDRSGAAGKAERHSGEDGSLSLFDVDSVAVKRARHRVVMALYGDAPVSGTVREVTSKSERAAIARDFEKTTETERDSAEARVADVADPAAAGEGKSASGVVEHSAAADRSVAGADVDAAAFREPAVGAVAPEARHAEPVQPVAATKSGDRTAAPSAADAVQERAVLGELLNADVRTVSDVIASTVTASAIGQEPVTDLRKALCNNDRFLLARDLFNGDMAECERTIDRLNEFSDLDECMIYITENFDWNPNSDGAKLLVDLIERKLA